MTNSTENGEEFKKVRSLQSDILRAITNSRILICLASGAENNLLQTLNNSHIPITSYELSEKCDMGECYVKEWLDTLVSCHIIDVIEHNSVKKYSLRNFNERSLISLLISRPESPNFMEILYYINESFQYKENRSFPLSILNETEDFYHVKSSNEIFPWNAIKSPYEAVPGLVNRLRAGISVLDSSCGSRSFIFSAAKNFPKSIFIGVDSSKEVIEKAKKRHKNLSNIYFIQCRVDEFPSDWRRKFHYIRAANLLRKVLHPNRRLRELYRVLKIDGTISVIERELSNKLDDNTQEKVFPQNTALIQVSGHDENDMHDFSFRNITVTQLRQFFCSKGFKDKCVWF